MTNEFNFETRQDEVGSNDNLFLTFKMQDNQDDDIDILSSLKSLNKNPREFIKNRNYSDSESSYSSSESESESSDDFPSPNTPVRNRKSKSDKYQDNNHQELFDKVKELQRRLYEMELQNRKLKSQAKR